MTITKLRPTFTFDQDRLDALRVLAPEAFADNQLGCIAPSAGQVGCTEADRRTFTLEICRRCDARFSCASYRAYAHLSSRGNEPSFRQYFDDFGDDTIQGERTAAGLTE